jgi:nucleoside-diphosphate-sugar epimerase
MRVCVVGHPAKLGRYMVGHALARDYEVVGVCREQRAGKLDAYRGRIKIVRGANDPEVIRRALAGCDGALVVLVPWGMKHYASGTARAVLDRAAPDARRVQAHCPPNGARDLRLRR